MTLAASGGRPNGEPGPMATASRAYIVPARVATYATASVRHTPRHASAMPKTMRICASAPHTGRSSAGTNNDRGVRSSASHQGSCAWTEPSRWTGWKPQDWFWTIWKTAVSTTAASVIGTARNRLRANVPHTAARSGPHSVRAARSSAARFIAGSPGACG